MTCSFANCTSCHYKVCCHWEDWEDFTWVSIVMKVKKLPKVLKDRIFKQYSTGKTYRAIAKIFNIPVSTIGSIMCRWNVHWTTTNRPQTCAPIEISQPALRLIRQRSLQKKKHKKKSHAQLSSNIFSQAMMTVLTFLLLVVVVFFPSSVFQILIKIASLYYTSNSYILPDSQAVQPLVLAPFFTSRAMPQLLLPCFRPQQCSYLILSRGLNTGLDSA